jgi:hypothetical protein
MEADLTQTGTITEEFKPDEFPLIVNSGECKWPRQLPWPHIVSARWALSA